MVTFPFIHLKFATSFSPAHVPLSGFLHRPIRYQTHKRKSFDRKLFQFPTSEGFSDRLSDGGGLIMEAVEWQEMAEEGCTTPRSRKYRIPAASVCPPPPRKKSTAGMMRGPPRNGFFRPPELESLFYAQPRREAWA
ncbi:PREDICTED: uncharacterized protein LOC109117276 [Tarenaya hassleriana]|uniref:uncharacterized protein LOC109117276 n=1 Tax=Tarenaya hassleriana TaxID=28532 RepID=UPI0008FD2E8E|nr:PREDICTED: uncharacterized protein LOC109117276 [Tarenaya hassleriana]